MTTTTHTPRPLPTQVGYPDAYTEVEYGIFVDRTEKRLGYALVDTAHTPERAQERVGRLLGTRDVSGMTITADHVFICARMVTRSPWQSPYRPTAEDTHP